MIIECPGCRLKLPHQHLDPPDRTNASGECLQLYSDLMCYTVAKQDPEFIHQHAVDTHAAQHAGGPTRNITVAFGLIGSLPCAGERLYRQAGAAGAYEHREDKKDLAPAGTSPAAGSPDGHGCAPGGNRC